MGANDVLVDTAGFLALWDAADERHKRAVHRQAELAAGGRRFLTSDYIVDETVTLLLVRHSHSAAADFLQTITASERLQLHWVSPSVSCRCAFFARHHDKEWSFTDCVSFTLMPSSALRFLHNDRYPSGRFQSLAGSRK
jgi:predicted nucleic acid-binding protein